MDTNINKMNLYRLICLTLTVILVSSTPMFFISNPDVYGAVKKVKITYNANGGKFTAKKYAEKKSYSKKKKTGQKHGRLPKVKRDGYKLKGWYTKKSGGKKVTRKTKIEKKTKLYARWDRIEYPKNLPVKFQIESWQPVGSGVSVYIQINTRHDADVKANLSGYKCYYRPKGDAVFKTVNVTKEKPYVTLKKLDPTMTYEVYFTAKKKDGTEYVRTEMTTFKIGNNLIVPVITGVKANTYSTAFSEYFDFYYDVTHYKVYASASINGKYKLVKTYTMENQSAQFDPVFGLPDNWKGNFVTYKVGVMKPGKSYHIKVRSVYQSKKTGKTVYSKFSAPSKDKLKFKTFKAPKGVKVSNKQKTSAKVSWKEYKGQDPYGYHYKIYLKKGKKGKFKCVKTIKRYSYVTSYTLKKLKKNTKYTVYVRALNSHGDKSKASKKVTFKTI